MTCRNHLRKGPFTHVACAERGVVHLEAGQPAALRAVIAGLQIEGLRIAFCRVHCVARLCHLLSISGMACLPARTILPCILCNGLCSNGVLHWLPLHAHPKQNLQPEGGSCCLSAQLCWSSWPAAVSGNGLTVCVLCVHMWLLCRESTFRDPMQHGSFSPSNMAWLCCLKAQSIQHGLVALSQATVHPTWVGCVVSSQTWGTAVRNACVGQVVLCTGSRWVINALAHRLRLLIWQHGSRDPCCCWQSAQGRGSCASCPAPCWLSQAIMWCTSNHPSAYVCVVGLLQSPLSVHGV